MGFVDDFRGYLSSRTDCPPDFHYHAALVALATALGNRVWCHGWTRPVYPNLWTVIIAPSGYGKSGPLDVAETVLQRAQLGARLLPNSFSYEALIAALVGQPVGSFVLQEFSAFLGMLSRDYNAGAVPLLTEIFDCPPLVRRTTMKAGETSIEQPCLSILGASSPAWFAERFKEKDLEGGFLARFLFCPSTETGPPVGDPGPPDDGALIALADHLRRAGQLRGLADFAPVQRAFEQWNTAYRHDKLRHDCPPEFAGSRARAGLLVKKAAMLFRVSRDPTGLQVAPRDLTQAIDYVAYTQERAERFLSDEVARDADEADRLRLVQRLRARGGRMGWSELLRVSHLRADKFARAVDTLRQANRVDVLNQPTEGGGRPSKSIVLFEANGCAPAESSRELLRTL